MAKIEEELEPIFFNIENAIRGVYREHPELSDYQVDSALEALGKTYFGEAKNKPSVQPKNPLAVEVYNQAKLACDFHLGRYQAVDQDNQPLTITPLTMDEMLSVLKRLRKSLQLWNKQSGSQGYLNYISQFIP